MKSLGAEVLSYVFLTIWTVEHLLGLAFPWYKRQHAAVRAIIPVAILAIFVVGMVSLGTALLHRGGESAVLASSGDEVATAESADAAAELFTVTPIAMPSGTPFGEAEILPTPMATEQPRFIPTVTPTPVEPTPLPEEPTVEAPPPPTEIVYEVQQGDTLQKIGMQYGVTWQEIAKANSLANPGSLSIGQKLVIPPKE